MKAWAEALAVARDLRQHAQALNRSPIVCCDAVISCGQEPQPATTSAAAAAYAVQRRVYQGPLPGNVLAACSFARFEDSDICECEALETCHAAIAGQLGSLVTLSL